ncbi:hypothetical protein NpNSSI1_00006957 [Neofusicoccum parvum]|nr:hypothetical protein NpNSSI1_00006957 [Neofusicoccum parvum]
MPQPLPPKILEDFLAQAQESIRKANMAVDSTIRKTMDDHTGSAAPIDGNDADADADADITAEEDWSFVDKHDGSDASDSECGGVIVSASCIRAAMQAKADSEAQDEEPPSDGPPLYPEDLILAMLRDRCEDTEQFLLKHNMHPISNGDPIIAAHAGNMAKVLEDPKSRQQWASEGQKWPTERTLRVLRFKCALHRADSRLRCLQEEIAKALRTTDDPGQVDEVERLRGELVKAHKGLLNPLLPPRPSCVPPVPGASGPVPDPAAGAASVQYGTRSTPSGYTIFPSAYKLDAYREALERDVEIARLKYEIAMVRIEKSQQSLDSKAKELVRGDTANDDDDNSARHSSANTLAEQVRSWPEDSLHVSNHMEWLAHTKRLEVLRALMRKERDEKNGNWRNRALRAEAALQNQRLLNKLLTERIGCTV